MKKLFPVLILISIFLLTSLSAVLISDQGTNVRNSTGDLVTLGNLTIEIYDFYLL